MPTRAALLFGVICFGFVSGETAQGESPAAQDAKASSADRPVRTDPYGDRLPQGAVARMGTERLTLRNGIFLSFSPDGRRLAAHNGYDQIRIWETDSGKELLRLQTPTFLGYSSGWTPLAFSPDSKVIALACPGERIRAGNRQPSVHVWEVATGKELHCFTLKGQASHLLFSPDGRYLFGGGYQVPLVCWDLAKDGTAKDYGDFPSIAFLALSRDGKTLTAGTGDKQDWRKRTFARWDVATGKEIGRHSFTTAGRWSGSLSPEGNLFAAPDADGKTIVLLDPLTGREVTRGRGSDYTGLVSFSADGTAMTCNSKDGAIRVWDTAAGKMRTRFQVSSAAVDWIALSPDGKRVALTGRADHAIHVWDVAAGRELHSFAGHRGGPVNIAFRKDGKEIVTTNWDMCQVGPFVTEWAEWSFRRWDAATGVERAVTSSNPKGEVHHAVLSADGRLVATIIHDGTLRLWDVESGKELRNWKVPVQESTINWNDGKGGKKVQSFRPLITQPVFTCDGQTLLAAEGPKIHRWEVETGRKLPSLEIEGISAREYSWCVPSPDGRTVVVWSVGSRYPPVRLVDAANGKIRRQLRGTQWGQNPPAFSPDGRTLAFEEFGAVSLWEVASGQLRGRLIEPRSAATLAFAPDGRLLAVGSDPESPLHLWDLASGQRVGELRSDLAWIRALAFSPDGSRLAVSGDSPTALICDVAALCGKKKIEDSAKLAAPSAEELEGLWAALTGADGAHAYRAIRRLALTGLRGAAFLKTRLKSDQPPDEQRIARLIADLDANKFAMREKAFAELGKLGVRAEPALRRTLEGEVSVEVRARVKRLLEKLGAAKDPPPSPELIRLRVVEALEANGSKEARQVLAELSEETTDARLAREAKASLERLSRRLRP